MTPVFSHFVYLQKDTWARVYLNDVPVYRSPHVGPESRSGPVNHFLREGENEITVELLRTTRQPYLEHVDDAFVFELYEVTNLDAPEGTPLERRVRCDVRYPGFLDALLPEHRRLPTSYRANFHIDSPLPRPAFFDAKPAEFDCAGLPEQRDAVRRIFDRLSAGDHEGFLEELSLRFDSDERAYPDEPNMRAGFRKQRWRDDIFPYDPRPDGPLDFAELHFEPRCGGRVAYVTRHDERHVLDVRCANDPKRRIRTDLLMMQDGGRWRVFA